MSRWKPDARGRLQIAAYELYLSHGYDRTTVADIAARAGLTERTFFRHFLDKREVLFSGSELFVETIEAAVRAVPNNVSTIDAVRAAVEAVARLMHGRRAQAADRRRVINAHSELKERELIKRTALTSALTAQLSRRGVHDIAAHLAADIGITAFYVGFNRWLDEENELELVDVVRANFQEIQAITGGSYTLGATHDSEETK